MTCCGTRHSRFQQHSCSAAPCAFGMTSFSASLRITAALLPGIKTIPTGRARNHLHTSCWIGLDDSTRENGCLQYIPGSHRWPELPITGLAGDMEAIHRVLSAEQREQFDAAVAVELKMGEASFHHPRLVHGSFANHSDRARRATVVNVMRDGVCSATNESLLQGVPIIPAGEKIEGQFFPLL